MKILDVTERCSNCVKLEARLAKVVEAARRALEQYTAGDDPADTANAMMQTLRAALAAAQPEEHPEVRVGDEFGWSALSGEPHRGIVSDIDGDVVYVYCAYHYGKECCTRLRENERIAQPEEKP